MDPLSRRRILTAGAGAAGGLAALSVGTAANALAATAAQPARVSPIGNDPGPHDPARDSEGPDLVNPPRTDHGTLPNLKFSFSDSHVRETDGGWTRQVTERELGISKSIAGVDMRLVPGGVREMHWHKQSEWSIMLAGTARITAVDQNGRNFIDDVNEDDLWYFPAGVPHSIQALDQGCEFLLVFDDGSFNEDSTFLISDWFKHVPPDVLAKNFGVPASNFGHTPDPEERYMFPMPVPGPIASDRIIGNGTVPESFSFRPSTVTPLTFRSSSVRIVDSSNFKAAKTIAAAIVEVEPGGMRELHWHPNTDEWQYYISGQARMGVFGASEDARTFDYRAGDVGYVPFAMGHYIENTGSTPLRFLEMFKAPRFEDVSLNQWMALTPPELVKGHLKLSDQVMKALSKTKHTVVPA